MDLDSLLQLLNNRLSVLNNGRVLAFNSGDLDMVNKMDADIFSTQDSINQIRLMQTLTTAANANNTTPANMVAEKIELLQNIGIHLDGPLDVLNYYDITSYATDPLHEEKIADILNTIGEMSSASVIDAYINTEAIASPVTGAMILSAGSLYNVDVRLMMAIMELDSRFGTAGVAVRTMNPGNVGNNGIDERTYPSWEDGVMAVAKWLDKHRVEKPDPVEEEIPQVESDPVPEIPEETTPVEDTPTPAPTVEDTVDVPLVDTTSTSPTVEPETTPDTTLPDTSTNTPVSTRKGRSKFL